MVIIILALVMVMVAVGVEVQAVAHKRSKKKKLDKHLVCIMHATKITTMFFCSIMLALTTILSVTAQSHFLVSFAHTN